MEKYIKMRKILIFLVCTVAFVNSDYFRFCYFTDWAHYRQEPVRYEPENYVPGLCTHILFAFAKVDWDFTAAAYDPADLSDGPKGGYFARVNKLKEQQPNLKTILSFGGWSAGTGTFKQMASDPANRRKFIDSAITFIDQYGFDGIDIDWEYPDAEDKANYVVFMKELKTAAGSRLVMAAVTADPVKVDAGYDVPSLADYLDFVNVMTYDFHGAWDQVTGENSPLYSPPGDTSNWNTAYALNYWAQKGISKNKLLVGIATYGRGWTLTDPSNHGIGAPGQPAPALQYTQAEGFGAYYEICNLGGTRYWDNNQKVPYVVSGNLWYGYDDVESVGIKMQWIKDNGFGGAFVWTLDFDDFNGICSGGDHYPLLSTIKNALGGSLPTGVPTQPSKTPPVQSSQDPIQTTKPTQSPGQPFRCPTPNGFFSDPLDCTKYYQCANNVFFHMSCPPGTEWNEKELFCDYPDNTVCFQ